MKYSPSTIKNKQKKHVIITLQQRCLFTTRSRIGPMNACEIMIRVKGYNEKLTC